MRKLQDRTFEIKKTAYAVFFATFILIGFPFFGAGAQSDGSVPPPSDTPVAETATKAEPTTVDPRPAQPSAPVFAAPSSAPAQQTAPKPVTQTAPSTPTTSITEVSIPAPAVPMPVSDNPEPEQEQSFPAALYAFIVAAIVAVSLGIFKMARGKAKKEATPDRCGGIKKQLDQKRGELSAVEKKYSLQQLALDALRRKIEEKKGALQGKVKDAAKKKIKDAVGINEKTRVGRALNTAESAKETYDDLKEKFEQAKKIQQVLESQIAKCTGEVRSLEAAYAACVAGQPVMAAAAAGGLKIDLSGASRTKRKLILFDFDGVIVDTLRISYETLLELEPSSLTLEQYRGYFNGNIYEAEGMDTQGSIEDDPFFPIYSAKMMKIKPVAGITELLESLSHRATMIIVSSTTHAPIVEYLRHYKLDQYFKKIYGVEVHKNKDKKIHLALHEFKTNSDDSIFITDTLGDMREARKAGVRSIGVEGGFQYRESLEKGEPIAIAQNTRELRKAINAWLEK